MLLVYLDTNLSSLPLQMLLKRHIYHVWNEYYESLKCISLFHKNFVMHAVREIYHVGKILKACSDAYKTLLREIYHV